MAEGKLVEPGKPVSQRLLSLDFMRGLTMVLLTLESTRLYSVLEAPLTGTPFIHVLHEFWHHPWHGLHMWDLVQPVFMFVAGTAMAFSYRKQRQQGMSWNQSFRKTLKRCGWLFFWGVLDYAVTKDGLELRLWDVLTQLSFTTLVAFLIMGWPAKFQIVVSLLCLLIPELLYRFTHIPNYDQPFTDQHNFGNYMDMVLMGRTNTGGWVAINCISTSAHTIWGVLAGQLLLSNRPAREKMRYLIGSGIVLLLMGFGLDWTGVTPIIKRIATSTFVLASGGWAFFEIVGDRWFTGYVFDITNPVFSWVRLPANLALVLGSLVVFTLEAGMMYFLYRKKIFFKL